MTIETTVDVQEWARWCEEAGVDDIYYRLRYVQIWEDEERGEPIGVRYRGDDGVVLYPVVRVPLDALGGDNLVDVRTAYDFGGPLALGEERRRLLERFYEHWMALVREWNVVTEFARLHPLRAGVMAPDAIFHTDVYVVDLQREYGEIRRAYESSFTGQLGQAEQKGLAVVIDEDPGEKTRQSFCEMYRETMDRVGADPFYFFSPQTLCELMALPEAIVASTVDGRDILASAIVLRSGRESYYFLAASRREALDLRPNNILLDRVVRDAGIQGHRYLHLGGGKPGVRHFKSQIATDTVPYYLLKRIHRPDAYDTLCQRAGVQSETIFPAYRPEFLDRTS